jgi:hypothetical protein
MWATAGGPRVGDILAEHFPPPPSKFCDSCWDPIMPKTRDDFRMARAVFFAIGMIGAGIVGCHKQQSAPATVEVQTAAAKEVAVVEARSEPWPQTIRV